MTSVVCRFVETCGGYSQIVVSRQALFASDGDIGARLRAARQRRGLNQTDCAAVGGVSLNTQGRYESGGSPLTIEYLRRIAALELDGLWILAGLHSADTLTPITTELVDAFTSLGEAQQSAVLMVTQSLAGQRTPVPSLPPRPAIEAAFEAFREGTPTDDPDELLRELAMQLPSILRGAGASLPLPASDDLDDLDGQPEAVETDHRASRRGRRT